MAPAPLSAPRLGPRPPITAPALLFAHGDSQDDPVRMTRVSLASLITAACHWSLAPLVTRSQAAAILDLKLVLTLTLTLSPRLTRPRTPAPVALAASQAGLACHCCLAQPRVSTHHWPPPVTSHK